MGIFKSKKFLTALFGTGAEVLFYYLGIPVEIIMTIAGIIISYIVGQGLSDIGKEAAKINGTK